MLGNYSESYNSFKSAIAKLRVCRDRKSAFFGIALNQIGLAINKAVELFEEAKIILEAYIVISQAHTMQPAGWMMPTKY
ncbi:hypothetical protein HRI_005017400 [Hibiscus trionum]|uniref:Uncharacterized protein n=1 Tax=Hibiscus trionum TaxID=183268 RepID=A0A9W7MSL2_HIBTR|nr:hypothetical protein HRI_005017100 [Hibiscus trionum]GMJ13480.1 hypothetical protein HRI_005017200 [Hibiscus trionum]GMJ13481.1 hypothetical protein HRI_005017300 [Hibiscus trionum]GMJ13482.1 hypothetical protein HRI_005017400 [Hibiscus trionum]